MTLDGFWMTIDDARSAAEKFFDIPAWLVDHLSAQQEREIIDFSTHLQDCMHRSYDANLWLGAVVLIGGCGDDRFTDFRYWLIAQGRDRFEAALADPDSIADLEAFDGDYGYPILFLGAVAREAFCKRVAGKIDDFAACERFESLLPVRKHPPLKNQELVNTSDEDAKALFPRLAARFPSGIRGEKFR